MGLSLSGFIAYARTEEARKKLRYAGVSVVFVPLGQGLIQVFGLWLDDYTTASLLAAAILTVPGFFANKHFVWRVRSGENLRFQVLVYWVAVMLAVSLATLFTYLIENAMADQTVLCPWRSRFLRPDAWLWHRLGLPLPDAGPVALQDRGHHTRACRPGHRRGPDLIRSSHSSSTRLRPGPMPRAQCS